MKNILAFAFLIFVAGASLAQIQTENHPVSPQEGLEGWYPQHLGGTIGNVTLPLHFLNRDTGWAGEFFTTNGGNTWSLYQGGRYVLQFIDRLHGWSASTINHGGTDIWISATTNGGESWTEYNTGFDVGSRLYFTNPSHGVMYVSTRIARTIDGGKTWKRDTTNVGYKINAFASFDSLTIVAVGEEYFAPANHGIIAGSIFLTTNGGDSWRYPSRQFFDSAAFKGVVVLDSTTIMIVATTKFVAKSINRGYSMSAIYLGDTEETALNAISAPNSRNIIVVGDKGKIFRTTDGGTTWKRQNSGTTKTLYTVNFADSLNGWAASDSGFIIHTGNGGYSWVNPPENDSLHFSAVPNPSNFTVSINYSLPVSQHVSIAIYDIAGHIVSSPLTSEMQSQGQHTVPVDVHLISSGTYILSIQTEQYRSVINCVVTH